MSGYQEIAPPEDLRRFVDCFWFRRSELETEDASHRVLPDGCIDIVFNFGDRWEREDEIGRIQNAERAYVVGVMTKPITVHSQGKMDFFGIRFHPGMAPSLLPIQAADLTDGNALLSDLAGKESQSLIDRLALLHPRGRATELEAVLRRWLAGSAVPDPRVQAAVSAIVQSNGQASISEIGSSLGMSRQHVARLFHRHVGISPKLLSRIFRFRSIFHGVRASAEIDWADTAARFGYYDQPHLILDFKEFTGQTPGEYFAL